MRPVHDNASAELDEVVDALVASSRALVAVSARSIAGARGVTLPQFRMLVVLGAGPTTLTELAAGLDVAPSTALRMVDRLVAGGLIDRSPSAEDRRKTRLALTPAGRRTVRTVTRRRRRDLQAVIQQIPPSQRADLASAMTTFAVAAARVWPTDPTSALAPSGRRSTKVASA